MSDLTHLTLPRFPSPPESPASRATSFLPFVPSEDIGWGPARITAPTRYAQTGRNARLVGWEANSIVNACCSIVADSLAAVPIQTYTKKEDGSPVVQPLSAPARELLERPGIGMNALYLKLLSATHFQLYGNAFWVLERPNRGRSPKRIRLVHPEDVLFVLLDPVTLEIITYTWRDRYGREHTTLATDMVHWKDVSAGDWIFGYPRAVSALLEMATDREASNLARQYLVNDGSPGHVALVEPNSTSRDTEDAQKRYNARMVDRGLRGSVAFLRGVKQWIPVGFNLEQLEFPDLRAITGEKICTAFRVDPRMVGVASAKGNEGGLSQAGYGEARRRLYSQTVIPMMRSLEATLDDSYAVEWGHVYTRFDPDVVSEMLETPTERVDRTGKMLSAGGITRQEYRKANRLPEEMEPNDTLVGGLGRFEYPVSTQFATGPAAAKITDGGEGEDGEEDDDLPEPTPSPDEDAKKKDNEKRAKLTVIEKPTRFLKRGMVLSENAQKMAWERFDVRATQMERPYQQAALVLFEEERREIVGEIEEDAAKLEDRQVRGADPILVEATARAQRNYKPGGKYHRRWADRYKALISETVVAGGAEIGAELGISFTLTNPNVERAILARAEFLASKVSDYSSQVITDVLAEAQRQGMGAREAANLLTQALEGLEPSRAIRIARTETIGALNEGEHLSADQSGVVVEKGWLCMFNNSRETHEALSGTRVALGERFSNGGMFPGDNALEPGEKINCRCTLLYYT